MYRGRAEKNKEEGKKEGEREGTLVSYFSRGKRKVKERRMKKYSRLLSREGRVKDCTCIFPLQSKIVRSLLPLRKRWGTW